MRIFPYIIISLLILSNSLLAQSYKIQFKNIGIKDGLLHSTVNAIAEDKLGFIWFATQDGLNRFDGYEFKAYYAAPNSNKTILNSWVKELFVDSYGQVWIYYFNGGISRLNPITENFHHYTPDKSIEGSISGTFYPTYSDNLSNVFFEDSDSNVWIASNDGLNKYERELDNFEVLKNDPSDINSLSDNHITFITEDSDKLLWIGTSNGLNRYNYHTKEIKRFTSDILGINCLNDTSIISIKTFPDSSVWVGTANGGLNIINYANSDNPKVTYLITDPIKKCSRATIFNIFRTKLGHVYVGSRNGLYKITKDNNKHKATLISKSRDEQIYHFTEDYKGNVWVGSDRQESLLLINPIDKTIVSLSKIKNSNYNYRGEPIQYIYKSTNDILWIACEKGGVYRVDLNAKAFYSIDDNTTQDIHISNKNVFSIYEDKNKILYIGTINDLNRINLNSYESKRFNGKRVTLNNITYNTTNYLPSYITGVIKETKDEKLWLGAFDNKISLYNPKTEKFLNFHQNNQDDKSFKIWSLRSICLTKNGSTYFGGTSGGLGKLNPDGLSFSFFPIVEYKNTMGNSYAMINSIVEGYDGKLWIGTLRGGLNLYNPDDNSVQCYLNNPLDSTSLINNNVRCILCPEYSDKNLIWMGTMGGISILDLKQGVFTSLTVDNGMPSNTISGILEDNNGDIWVSSNNGIAKINPNTLEIISYTQDDGVSGNEFNEGAFFKNLDGVLYFGGNEGVTYFNPDNIKPNPHKANVVFSNFKLFNKTIHAYDTVNGRILLKKSISYTREIFLKHNEKVISFEFTCLNYIAPKKIKYRYILEGFEDEWNDVGASKRFANYTNLPSGDYTLKAKSTNSDGVWCDPIEIKIHILPPFWETIWFRGIMLSSVLLLIMIVIKLRTSVLRRQKRVLESTVLVRTQDLSEANSSLEETKEELSQQNEELIQINSMLSKREDELLEYKNSLESKVKIRTSELKVAKEKAEESNQLKSSFLANMSHEIRTPLNAIVGFSSLFTNEGLTKEDTHRYVGLIRNNSDSLLTIISDIIDISSIQVGQLKIKKHVFNFNDTLLELKSFYDLKNNKDVEMIFVPDNSMRTTQIDNDSHRFRQIMNNLIGNAIKFTKKGFVIFGYEVIASRVRFYVHDSGPGIAYDAQANIFQYFNKINIDKDTFHEGTGLGLAISKSLVEQMGGNIWFESEPKQGSKFMFELPYSPGE